jgi:hypothetical protein
MQKWVASVQKLARVQVSTNALPDTLKTAEVADHFRDYLETHFIDLKIFAQRMKIRFGRMETLLSVSPPAWPKLGIKEKKVYMKMCKLMQISPEEIELL